METSLSQTLDLRLLIRAMLQQILVLNLKPMVQRNGANHKVKRRHTIHLGQIELPISGMPPPSRIQHAHHNSRAHQSNKHMPGLRFTPRQRLLHSRCLAFIPNPCHPFRLRRRTV